jgi:HK97 gp10 family phage protein
MSVKFESNLNDVKVQFDKNIGKTLISLGIHAQARAVETITEMEAVDTGRLRASIAYNANMEEKEVIIGTNVEYAIEVHEGTARMNPRRFLSEALLNNRGEYKEIIDKTMKEGF